MFDSETGNSQQSVPLLWFINDGHNPNPLTLNLFNICEALRTITGRKSLAVILQHIDD